MNQKHQQNMHNAYVNVNLRVVNVIQIKRGIIINVNVNAKIKKNILCTEKITFGILVEEKAFNYMKTTRPFKNYFFGKII